MNDIDDFIICGVGLLTLLYHLEEQENIRKKQKSRSFRINPYLVERERNMNCRFFKDFEDMKKKNVSFNENFHIDVNTFENIFNRLEERLTPKIRTKKNEICARQKFADVFEFLASGSL